MAFCSNCGAQLVDGAQACPNCGAQLNTAPAKPASDPLKGVKAFFAKLLDTPDHSAGYTAEDIADTKMLCIFSYLSIFVLIPLLVKKDSPYAKFHNNQGLVLTIIGIAYDLIWWLFAGVIGAVFAPFGTILNIIFGLGSVVLLAATALGIYYAVTGKAKELPYIGSYTILK